MNPRRKGNAGTRISFTVFVSPGRLSKEYRLQADGGVEKVSGTQFAQGNYRVVSVDASDPRSALVLIGSTIDGLSSQEAIGLGVPTNGTTTGRITTKERFAPGSDAIPRALSHFGWPQVPGLLLLDGDDIDGLYELLRELFPPFANIAFLSRPSASASVIDPSSGKALKRGEHGYVLVDEPSKSKECLEALMRLAWCCGTGNSAGRLQLSKSGSVLLRGPVDASVGSPERLSYEGAAVVGPGLETLPRKAKVLGGNGILMAAELIEFADRVAPASLFAGRWQSAADNPEFRIQRDEVRAKYRAEHVKAAVARGTPRQKAEADYDRVTAMGVSSVGRWSFVPLTPDHRLWRPDGRAFTVADIQKNPAAFHDTECADPVEGLDYQSRNCAIIYTDGSDIKIYSRAHGDAFAYVAPLDVSELWEAVLARLGEAHQSDPPNSDPTQSEDTAAADDEVWDPWRDPPAPRLDHSLLPRAVREAAAVSARVSGADADAFAVGYLVGLAACCDTRLGITPKQHARDWTVPLLLWVLLVAPPSSMKTAVISAARALPASLDAQDRSRHSNEVATAGLPIALSMAKMTKADAKRAEAEAIRKIAPPRQRAVGDVTTEKYVEILGANPGGCAMFRDEMSGFLGSLGRYSPNGSDGADRAFYCNLRDGSPYDRQRITKPSVHLDHCAGSFLGAVQPDRLLDMKLPTSDGLLQRFLPVLMHEASSYEDIDYAGDAKVILQPVRDALAAIAPILQQDPFGHTVATPYKLTPEGSNRYKKFADDMRLAARAQQPSREFAECLNKMGPMWLSLALLFHFVDSREMGASTPAECVPLEVVLRVDAIMRGFFIPHAELFYVMLDVGTKHRHRSIATAILRCQKDQIVLRDVARHCRALQGKPRDEQIKLMQRFETGGWLTRTDRNGPVPRWVRAPGLADRFAADLEREEAARKAVTAAISGGGASA